jgi:hypothetical protein
VRRLLRYVSDLLLLVLRKLHSNILPSSLSSGTIIFFLSSEQLSQNFRKSLQIYLFNKNYLKASEYMLHCTAKQPVMCWQKHLCNCSRNASSVAETSTSIPEKLRSNICKTHAVINYKLNRVPSNLSKIQLSYDRGGMLVLYNWTEEVR